MWLGWRALVPLLPAVAWTWANPKVFPPPAKTRGWASKATFGDRVFLNRKTAPVPDHHMRWALSLGAWADAAGLGALGLDPVLTVRRIALVVLPKVWFCDRMVRLYEDM